MIRELERNQTRTQRAVVPGPVLVAGAGAGLGVVGAVARALVRAHGLGDLAAGSTPARLTVALAVDAHPVG